MPKASDKSKQDEVLEQIDSEPTMLDQVKDEPVLSDGETFSQPQEEDSGAGEAEVQEIADEVNKRGYFGHAADETPREDYTFNAKASGSKTPDDTYSE
jgi:hypothetical protein